MNRPCILRSDKFIDMVAKLPLLHAEGFEILEKFCFTNGSSPFVKVQMHGEPHSQSSTPPPSSPGIKGIREIFQKLIRGGTIIRYSRVYAFSIHCSPYCLSNNSTKEEKFVTFLAEKGNCTSRVFS